MPPLLNSRRETWRVIPALAVLKGSCSHVALILILKMVAAMLWLLPVLATCDATSCGPGKISLQILHWEGTRLMTILVVARVLILLLLLWPCWVTQPWDACLIRHAAVHSGQWHLHW